MSHLLSILFFASLLVGLAVILDLTVRAYWAEIVAALRGPAPRRAAVRSVQRPRAVA